MEEIRVESWRELYEHLFADSWNERLGLFRLNSAFRGGPDATNELSTSLARLTDKPASVERPLVRHFRKYAARDEVPVDSLWNWLALAQHHGLPRVYSTGRSRRRSPCTSRPRRQSAPIAMRSCGWSTRFERTNCCPRRCVSNSTPRRRMCSRRR